MAWTLASMQADRDAVWNWVIECTPQLQDHMEWQNGWGDEAAWGDDGTDWLNHITYLSHRPFETTSSDTPPSTAFHPVLIEPINFHRSTPFEGDGGIGTTSYGSISIALPEELDGLLASYWSGRVLRLLAGGTYNVGKSTETTATWSEYAEVGKYYITDFDYDESTLRLYLRDALWNIDLDLPTPISHQFKGPIFFRGAQRFRGTNSFLEGGENLKGLHKPLVIGVCRNVEFHQTSALYQVFFGSQRVMSEGIDNPRGFDAITTLRDQGIERTKYGDVNESLGGVALEELTIPTNQWASNEELGLIRLQAEPQGTVTCDCTGGFVDNTINKILVRIIKWSDPGAVLGDSLLEGTRTLGAETGSVYVGLEEFNPGFLIAGISNNAGLFIFVNRAGKYEVGQHKNLSDSTSYTVAETLEGRKSQVDTPLDIVRLNRLPTRPPVYSVVVSYDRNWTVQDIDDFDQTISIETREDYKRESRYTEEATTGEIVSQIPTARKIVLEGGYVTNLTDAESIRDDIIARSTLTPNMWEVEIIHPLFSLEVNDVVTVFHDRFGFDAGKDAEIISMVEQHDRAILTVVTAQ